MKRLAILGCTGSIGVNCLKLVERFPDRYRVAALAAGRNVGRLAEQIRRFQPEAVAIYSETLAVELQRRISGLPPVRVFHGEEGYRTVATWDSADTVVGAMVGAAGLLPTLAAIDAGKQIALANKETLVMAGAIVTENARRKNVAIVPIDSEHSAVFQCLAGNRRSDLEKVLLTGSGGPFRTWPEKDLARATVEDALRHPNWQMGAKISVDSATLMNKGLEVIEARWLFDLRMSQIEVLIHPQSVIHSMAQFRDGSVMAQMGIPDMTSAIAYALSYPERLPAVQPAPDFAALGQLTFEAPDLQRFPCLALALEASAAGGTTPAVLNAANEEAVDAFLNRRLGYVNISQTIRETLSVHQNIPKPDLGEILDADRWARRRALEIIGDLGD